MAQQPRRLATILSFSHDADDADQTSPRQAPEEELEGCDDDGGDCASDDSGDSGDSFEFAFARPLVDAAGCSGGDGGDGDGDFAVADDLFAHGRILPAYPVFDRRNLLDDSASAASASSSFTAPPPSPDTYCAWAPRSAPGSPARGFFPKSASTGTGTREAPPHRFRLRDLVSGATRRSHSDGKEKFVFLQPTTPQRTTALSSATAAAGDKRSKKKPAPPPQAGGKKKGGAVSTEMDMATAHRLFYSKTGGERRQQQQHATSYLPYRPGIVGFFAAAHALGRSPHRPY